MDPYYKHLVTSKHEWNFRYNLFSAKKVSKTREAEREYEKLKQVSNKNK